MKSSYLGTEGEAMDVLEALKGRRSIRVFKAEEVSEEIVQKLIDAGRWG